MDMVRIMCIYVCKLNTDSSGPPAHCELWAKLQTSFAISQIPVHIIAQQYVFHSMTDFTHSNELLTRELSCHFEVSMRYPNAGSQSTTEILQKLKRPFTSYSGLTETMVDIGATVPFIT